MTDISPVFRKVAKDVELTLIPYYAWVHRGESDMDVWLPIDSSKIKSYPTDYNNEKSPKRAGYEKMNILSICNWKYTGGDKLYAKEEKDFESNKLSKFPISSIYYHNE